MITLLESKLFLAKLPPMKSVMCVLQQKSSSPARCGGVAAKGRKIGTAISDPYLGFARPLSSVETLLEVENLIDEHKPGGLIFLSRQQKLMQELLQLREMKTRTTKTNLDYLKIYTVLEDPILSIDEALRRKETEWEMWEEIENPNDGKASTEAAIALNGWLWTNCGGWRNTFG